MSDNSILDDKLESGQTAKNFRVVAVILEFLPLILLLSGLFKTSPIAVILLFLVPFNYLFFGWYFFKAAKYNWRDILLAELGGFIITLGALGILFKIESWENAATVINGATIFGLIFLGFLVYRFITKREEPLEYRFSAKLFSRIFVFVLFYFLIENNLISLLY